MANNPFELFVSNKVAAAPLQQELITEADRIDTLLEPERIAIEALKERISRLVEETNAKIQAFNEEGDSLFDEKARFLIEQLKPFKTEATRQILAQIEILQQLLIQANIAQEEEEIILSAASLFKLSETLFMNEEEREFLRKFLDVLNYVNPHKNIVFIPAEVSLDVQQTSDEQGQCFCGWLRVDGQTRSVYFEISYTTYAQVPDKIEIKITLNSDYYETMNEEEGERSEAELETMTEMEEELEELPHMRALTLTMLFLTAAREAVETSV